MSAPREQPRGGCRRRGTARSPREAALALPAVASQGPVGGVKLDGVRGQRRGQCGAVRAAADVEHVGRVRRQVAKARDHAAQHVQPAPAAGPRDGGRHRHVGCQATNPRTSDTARPVESMRRKWPRCRLRGNSRVPLTRRSPNERTGACARRSRGRCVKGHRTALKYFGRWGNSWPLSIARRRMHVARWWPAPARERQPPAAAIP
eukprot:scaffold549_cov385-Prasinococcus_capsulatus_cf.AAC.35